jgi:N-dimethylarginine dimethylaminohydrolase
MKLTTRDIDKLTHINSVMNDIHDSTTLIYEHLVDEEFEPLRIEINITITKLNALLASVQDEI